MDETQFVDLARSALVTTLVLVTPALLVGMVVGLVMSLLQTITSVQEQTLAIVPKMLAVVATLLVLLPWLLGTLREYARGLFQGLAEYGLAGI